MNGEKYPFIFRTQHDTADRINQAHLDFLEAHGEDLNDNYAMQGRKGYSRSRFLEDVLRVSLGLSTTKTDSEPFVNEALRNGLKKTRDDIARYEKMIQFLTEHSKQILQAA